MQGWRNPAGDAYFVKQRERADRPNDGQEQQAQRAYWFKTMFTIGNEIQRATGAFKLDAGSCNVLDLCMAPGGFSQSILQCNPSARISALTLPLDAGGYMVLLPHGARDSRVEVQYLDITMLVDEFDVTHIDTDHPDALHFLHGQRPYLETPFDLVICDGQVLRTHQRAPYREACEATRLILSQLVIAMQRIRQGATIVVLLHKSHAWNSIELLYEFSKFASVRLFKPTRIHSIRSSFYMIATEVNPAHDSAKAAVEKWKSEWRDVTFHGAQKGRPSPDRIQHVLDEFGETLIRIGEPIWKVQRDGLANTSFIRK